MNLPEPLIKGNLVERYKRFLADMRLESGPMVTTHCPNSGSMMGLLQPGNPVLLSKSKNPKRKLPYTWELVRVNGTWVCVNTANPNRLIHEALLNKQIPELSNYSEIKREAAWGDRSRLDFLLKNDEEPCFVEVKNVTLAENGVALFPDAKTKRGVKHLRDLMEIVGQGMRGVMCFLVHREDCNIFKPADAIDPVYAETLRNAHQAGVEILVYRAKIRPPAVTLDLKLKFEL
jgi:sugar fermentation stimulation protein A